MSRVTLVQQNFSGGEAGKAVAGRFDLGVYYNSAAWVQNFLPKVQGTAQYRDGTAFVWNTAGDAATRLIPFEYNTEQAYILAFSLNTIRIIKDGGLVTDTAVNITGLTNANPGVVTATAHGYSNGDKVVIQSVGGMFEVNSQEYTVANKTANTFELSGVDTTNFTAYTSGGTVAKIIEVTTTYTAAELFEIEYVQTNDTLYLVHPDHAPATLTRSSHTSWTLANITFISNPFGTTKAASQAITAATKANPCVVTYGAADTYANGDTVFITGIVGMTELNDRVFTVANVNTVANTFELQGEDSTNHTAYTSGGTIEEFTAFSYPAKVAFFEKRVIYAASDNYPQRLWGSKGGSDNYNNFLTGTNDDDSFVYTLAAGQANRIMWMQATEDFLAIGTAGAEFKAEGGNNEPITPTNISIKPTSYYGSADIKPISLDSHILYVQRDKITSRTFEFDALQDGFTSINRNLINDTILQGRYGLSNGAKQIAFQAGSPSINWVVKNDGMLAGLTFEPREQVNGWHRHIAGGTYSADFQSKPHYESVATIPTSDGPDQVYFVVARTVDGATVRHIEYFATQPNIPRRMDYYTGDGDKADNLDDYLRDLWEAQKRMWYLDAGLSYDGTISQTGTLTDRLIGTGVTFTAGGSTFTSADVGNEIWGKAGGIAVITAYTSGTVVTVEVVEEFPSVSIASGDWYLTFTDVYGLNHLEGMTIMALADGAVVEDLTVTNGKITLPDQTSYVICGLQYLGIWKGMDVEGGGDNGPSSTKTKTASKIGVMFMDTSYCKIGTDPYNLQSISFGSDLDIVGRPSPLFDGVIVTPIPDSPENEKHIYFIQDKPQPLTFQIVAPRQQVNDG